ncbi:MAG: hypothetical protein PUF16_02095 [Lachnospiraceae bacterium]|nr:hypothetical protein [Lachnospiraceae bacterium]
MNEFRNDMNVRLDNVVNDLPVVIDGKGITFNSNTAVVTNDAFRTKTVTDPSGRTTTISKVSGVSVNYVKPYGIVPTYTVDDGGTLTITLSETLHDTVQIQDIIVYRKSTTVKN